MRAYHALTFQRNATFFFVPERRKARYDNGCPASALEGTPCPGKRGLWKDIVDHVWVRKGRGCGRPLLDAECLGAPGYGPHVEDKAFTSLDCPQHKRILDHL
jgi:hypothetical protein